jgi:XapX domain-containing protein
MIMAAVGIALALLIGAGCRLLDIPLPAPPKIQGALLVLAMTVGFLSGTYLN